MAKCYLFAVGNKICGNVHINAEEVEEFKCNVHMQMYAINLDKKDFLGKVIDVHAIHTCTHNTHMHACTHARTHAPTHTHTHAHTHAHIHTQCTHTTNLNLLVFTVILVLSSLARLIIDSIMIYIINSLIHLWKSQRHKRVGKMLSLLFTVVGISKKH